MFQDSHGCETLRFHIQLPRADYKLLVSRLRGERGVAPPAPQSGSQVTALIDLPPNSTTFSITRLGRHRLPKPVSIRAGSATHTLLSQTISRELAQIDDPMITARLEAVIAACPSPLPLSLRISPADFVLSERTSDVSSSEPTALYSGAAVRVLATLAPSISLDLDDTPPLSIIEDSGLADTTAAVSDFEALRSGLASTLLVTSTVSGNRVTVSGSAHLPLVQHPAAVTLVAHWGSYDDLSHPWQDEPLALEISPSASDSSTPLTLNFSTTIHAPIHGSYGLTFYARYGRSYERIWIGRPWIDDHKFFISHDDPGAIKNRYDSRRELALQATTEVRRILSDPASAIEIASWFNTCAPHLSLGAMLASETSHSQATCEVLENCIETMHTTGAESLADSLSKTYGVGEVVFVTPEGPHAAAGGLAHVITGLPVELTKHGVPVTIIAPLYRYANGNKHRSAEDILKNGMILGGERVTPRYATTVIAGLGPTHYVGTGYQKRPTTSIPFKVYVADSGRMRLILLANSSTFDRLYQPVYADEQLRRAILFSRAALEAIATEVLDIRPSALISNDWMTACIPSLLALDPRYQGVPWLRRTKALHMIHNGGADYHGRLPLHFGNEDLWPMFGIAPEHFFGFRDPHRSDLINLTMAATQHATGGVITVSQPYARSLISQNGGDGLEYVLQHRRDAVFGISNGINRADIDRYLAARSGLTHSELQTADGLLKAKATLRSDIQRTLGLESDPKAKIISFVGRLAEQKGLDLLSGTVDHAPRSTLEDILERHPCVQIIIAGPITSGDRSATALHDTALLLKKLYPRRVALAFDYLSHSQALDIIAASTLFLMPSRFEPGGITQLESLAAGTPVVGRNVGGIGATVMNYNPVSEHGTGFLCNDYHPTAFANTIHWALTTCEDLQRYCRVIEQARAARHSWSDRAPTFLAVLQRIILGESKTESVDFLASANDLARQCKAASPSTGAL
ncbi:MAG: glycogen/starch synthase [Pseudomonadota bacterium]